MNQVESKVEKAGRLAVASRVVAAVVGGLGVALGGAVCLAEAVPDVRGLGLALALGVVVPLWCAAASVGFLARSARQAWLAYAVVAVGLGAAAWGLLILMKGG